MPRPTSKNDLLAAVEKERGALEELLSGISPEEMIEPGTVGSWSIKDVLEHVLEWEQMCLGWYRAGLKAEFPELPAPGFKWNQTPQLNQQIFENYRDLLLDDILAKFKASHHEILAVIQQLSNEDLFTAGRFLWTKKNTLGAYFVSATSSHYLWARKEIRKGRKARQS